MSKRGQKEHYCWFVLSVVRSYVNSNSEFNVATLTHTYTVGRGQPGPTKWRQSHIISRGHVMPFYFINMSMNAIEKTM